MATPRDSQTYVIGNIITQVNGTYTDTSIVGDISSNATDTTFTISGLDSSSTYWIAVIPFNNCTFGRSYRSLIITNVNKNDTITTGVNTTPCAEPSSLPDTVIFGTITNSSISGTFGKSFGSVSGYVVIYSKVFNIPFLKDSTTYTVGQKVLATDSARVGFISTNRNDTTFTISGLDSSTRYYIAVIPYNNCAGFGNNYRNLIINNVNKSDTYTTGTTCAAPTTSVATISFTNVTTGSIAGSFSKVTPSPTGYIVVYSTNGFISFPRDTNVQYTSGQILGTGTQQATVLKVASSTDTTFSVSGLLSNTKYHFWVFPYNDCAGTIKIRRTSVKRDSSVTLTTSVPCTEPTGASNITISAVSSSQVSGSFSASSPSADAYLVLRSTSATAPSITDAASYTVGQVVGSATVIANGSSTTFTASSLSANTRYYFFVYSYNNSACVGGPNYNTSSVAQIDTVTSFTTGIKSNKETAFKIYPNPVSNGKLNIQFEQYLNNETQIRIVDMVGRVMIQEQLPNNTKNYQFDVNELSKGIYYLQIGDKSNFSTVPFMKQ